MALETTGRVCQYKYACSMYTTKKSTCKPTVTNNLHHKMPSLASMPLQATKQYAFLLRQFYYCFLCLALSSMFPFNPVGFHSVSTQVSRIVDINFNNLFHNKL